MNHRESPLLSAGRREASSCLALMLLAPIGAVAMPRLSPPSAHSQNGANPICYLPVVGAPQLRFQPKPFVPEPLPKIASPTVAATSPTSTSPSHDLTTPTLANSSEQVAAASAANAADKSSVTALAPTAPKPPPAIIPDELRSSVRAEDFLPYFQMPGAGRNPGDVTLLAPVPRSAPTPAAIPPSSATYTQTPK